MTADHLAGWTLFLTSPAATATVMRPLQLDGYLTGLIVAPDLIPPSLWIDGLWGEDEPVFDTTEQLQTALGSVMAHYNAIIEHINKLGPNYRPMFIDEQGNADLDQAHVWVRGFWQAMALVPDAWSALAEEERTQILIEPFITFVDPDQIGAGPIPDNIDEIRRDSADLIPRVLPALRKLVQIRAARPQTHQTTPRKTGRNQPCPCGSGKKYKRCCGLN
jgi:uncharacterized protein